MKKIASILLTAVICLALGFGICKITSKPLSLKKSGQISIDKSEGYKLIIDGKPTLIKGVCYSPVPIGKDYEYNWWGDTNRPWLTDGKLMKEMGVNAVRIYRVGKNPDEVKQVIEDLYKKYGIYSLLGHYLGFWSWPPPNYANQEFRDKVKAEVLEMVSLYKDSPGVLMWVLGNENNYSFDREPNVQRWTSDAIDALPDAESQRKEKAKIYYTFVNDLAKEIKKIDPVHPVVMGVGEGKSLSSAKEYCPDIDVIGMIAYRGTNFGNLFRQIKKDFDLPVVLTEWGCDSYNAQKREPDQEAQADFIKQQWQDIERNSWMKKGTQNCIGGTLFEWNDEWWKANENLPYTWTVQDTAAGWMNASYYFDAQAAEKMNMNEEWWGVVELDPTNMTNGINKRIPKKAYYILKELWNSKQ